MSNREITEMEMKTEFNEVGSESEKPKQCPCKCGKGIAVFLILFLLAGVACWYIHHPNRLRAINPEVDIKPGMKCVLHLRQDAFSFGGRSMETSLPINIGDVKNANNSATVAFTGTIIAVGHEAIIFEAVYQNIILNGVPKTERFWIPKSNILFIQFQNDANF